VARTVRWTEAALRDLEEAAEFIARDSPFYASALVREARVAAKSLRSLAERGRLVPEVGSRDIRELFVQSYRLIYQLGPKEILVLAFVHGARDLLRIWAARTEDPDEQN
jgi:toxin ParE1/3/4